MEWKSLLSAQREYREYKKTDIRNAFQRDYDRIIFSNIFRRLQNKTQVFPLPGSQMVHNRLTHSLEVASVGRSIARLVSKTLCDKFGNDFLNEIYDIDIIVSSACLAHDLGNPPFGHSGEETISSYFTDGPGQKLKDMMPEYQWSDLASFEGNANAFRQLTHQFAGRRQGGMSLTYATLATLVKYPYLSYNKGGKKKYNVFYSEKETFKKVMDGCGIPCLDENNFVYARHPLSYMMEAADDICYLILDMEDAHKRGIVATQKIDRFFTSFFKKEETWFFERKESIYETVTDDNERMAFLRATVINKLVECVAKVFIDNYDDIMNGNFEKALVSHLPDHEKNAMEKCREFSLKNIYKHPTVVKVELTGFNVIGSLVDEFVNAALEPQKIYNKKLLSLIPEQFKNNEDDLYSRVQVVLDYISNMTDLYAVQLYKDLRGIR
ncbi:MAG: deoxyguanosinetriphosphate triphosphohydrolase [Lentimicrobiaceae bacterium]|nr:deoxyguanosinetriphosphate triphosphohydrolase [Lentimicrobiaceae bacterium]MBQ2907300.1 deoxyguanosinetriphosphate triphosphohydrolase [Bacteroidales bacterium]